MSSWLERRRLKRRAGASARRDYLRLTKQWRRENRRPFAIIGAAVTILFFVLCLLSAHHLVNFLAGAVAGGFLALFIALLGSPPGWIENYQRGAWGEQRTAAVLDPLLDEGWTVIHDLPRTKSNLDHVLIGPGGVFVA